MNVYRRIAPEARFRCGASDDRRRFFGGRAPNCRIVIRDRYLKLLEGAGIDSWARLTSEREGSTIARSSSTRTAATKASDTKFIFVKTYSYSWTSVRKGLIRHTFLGRSRARREWDAIIAQKRLRLPTVEPVAYAELRQFRFLRGCALVTIGSNQWAPAERSLGSPESESKHDRTTRIRAIGRWLASLHAAGFSDGNARLRNLVFDERGSPRDPRVRNLDSPRGRVHKGPLPARRRSRDLETLDEDARAHGWSRTDRVRLVRAYFGGASLREARETPVGRRLETRLRARSARSCEHRPRRRADSIDLRQSSEPKR